MPKKRLFENYFGFEAESDLIDEVAQPARYNRGDQYLNYNEALKTAGSNQPREWNPQDPPIKPSPFPNELHFSVSEEIERLADKNYDVFFYTARGSAFDKIHGVDCFFLFKNEDDRIIVTIDTTLNEDKAIRGHKADIIILQPENFVEMPPEEREEYEKQWAKEIVEKLEDKILLKTY